MTAHRREKPREPIRRIAEAVKQIAQVRPDALVVWPVHPQPQVREVVYEVLDGMSNVLLTEPIDYIPFLRACSNARRWRSVTRRRTRRSPERQYPVLGGPHRIRTPLRAWTAAL